MWPLLLDFAVPIAIHGFSKFMEDEDDSEEHLHEYLEELGEYVEELECRVQILEKKVRALQLAFLTTGILAITGLIIFGAVYFF